jgi:hypothetical protein
MEIESTTFGTITIDGKTYEHDVIIRLSGDVVKRNKKLSKKYYGTSHVLSKDEAKFVFEKGCEQLILGSGQMGNVHLSSDAEAYFAKSFMVLAPPPCTLPQSLPRQARAQATTTATRSPTQFWRARVAKAANPPTTPPDACLQYPAKRSRPAHPPRRSPSA